MPLQKQSVSVVIGFMFLVTTSLLMLPMSPAAHATEETVQAAPSPAAPQAPIASPVHTTTNPITRAAVDAGVLSCASRINQVSNYLTTHNKSAAYIFVPQGNPDRQLFSTSFEIITPNDSTLYASASFAPNQENGTGAVYDTVEYVEKTCDELAKTVFKDLKRIGVLKKNITLLEGGNVKIFLMPAGTGCVVIKKEVVK